MTASRVACLALLALGAARAAGAQTSTCDNAQRDREWAAQGEHSEVAGVLHSESNEFHQKWCRLWNTTGSDRENKAGDFFRVLFTSDGIRPAFGTAAQNAGPGGGVAFDMPKATKDLRFEIRTEVRGASSGSWDAGALLNIVGTTASGEAGHAYGSLEVQHVAATQRVYFVEGPAGATETHFRLDQTTARGVYHTHEFGGAHVYGEAGVAAFTPGSSTNAPSTDTVVTDAIAPGLSASTTYGVFGVGLNWHYPVREHLSGYSTQLSSSLRFFEDSGPYSFRRGDVTWAHQYSPESDKVGTFAGTARLITTTPQSGSRVPFYLQPALGGNDIEHDASLRSYEYGRFRAADTLAVEGEYTRTLWGPLALLLFVDGGSSGDALSSLGSWHHSEGIGLVIQAGGVSFARLYIAWGGGGHRWSGGGDSSKSWLDGAQRGVY